MKISAIIVIGMFLCFMGIGLYWLLVRPLRIHKEVEPFHEEIGKKLAAFFRVMFAALVKDRFISMSMAQQIEDGICASAIFSGNGPQSLTAECLCDLLAYFVSIREIEPNQYHTKQYVLHAVNVIREIVQYPYENCSSVTAFQGTADAALDRLDELIAQFTELHKS